MVSRRLRFIDHRRVPLVAYVSLFVSLNVNFIDGDLCGCTFSENVQVAARHMGTPHDVVVPFLNPQEVPESWKAWAQSCEPPTLVQLCHAGLQSCRGMGRYLWEPSIAPSSMRLSMGDTLLARFFAFLLFNTARMMGKEDIELVVQQFRAGAILAHRSGFQGCVCCYSKSTDESTSDALMHERAV